MPEPRVFLSYIQADQAWAQQVAALLDGPGAALVGVILPHHEDFSQPY